jgi:outer membrane receptor protein involved in Fe transport
MPSSFRIALVMALFVVAVSRGAEEKKEEKKEEPRPVEGTTIETTVTARRPITAASSDTVRDRDFLLRPHPRPADILMNTPGFLAVQHQGGGKANQYFLRGFDADHGTDVALFVDGVPVNLPSHAHGQGYADLNWVIPEVVEKVEVTKGPYFAQYGDFDTAGAFNLVTKKNAEASSFSLTAGQFHTWRALTIASPDLGDWKPLLAAEMYRTNGPFQAPEGLTRFSLFGKLSRQLDASSSLALSYTGYGVGWSASGQIPSRLVDAGKLDRFGAVDPTEGGGSGRHSLYATYKIAPDADREFTLTAYTVLYRLNLYNDFTFFLVDPTNGDEIEQDDNRTVAGVSASYRIQKKLAGIPTATTFGAQLRNDSGTVALHHVVQRRRIATLIDADVAELSLSPYAEEDTHWTDWLRTVIGLRADYFNFAVNNDRSAGPAGITAATPKTSGVADATILNPKANVILSPFENFDVFVNAGMGFHSNDARGVVTPLTRATGYEIGARTRQFDSALDLAATGFLIDLESELTFNGDTGGTSAAGATRRYGLELEARYKLADWGGTDGIFLDADATFTHAAFRQDSGNGNSVALAPTRVLGGGISVRHPSGFYGRLGLVSIGDRPASQDKFFTAQGFTRLDATLGYKTQSYELSLVFFNLTNTKWREAQFDTISLVQGESPAAAPPGTRPGTDADSGKTGIEDVNFTPGAPFNVQATATVFF